MRSEVAQAEYLQGLGCMKFIPGQGHELHRWMQRLVVPVIVG